MTFSNILFTLLIGPLQLLFEIIFSCANKITNNPGLTIISLSLSMNFLILPLYMRADALQEEERIMEMKLAKGVEHIKKTFKGDEKMMMLQTFYRQNGYKPTYVLRSALSLFLEIPFFIAAYRFLSTLPIIKGITFGPIADLGLPDQLIVIGSLSINLLPILMTAINAVSTAIFTKGYPLKTKVQLYAMALFFLVFLYDSPSGLVFYWTLNNLFSLVKTIFYKLKNPKKVLIIMGSAVGIVSIVFGFRYFGISLTRVIAFVGLGIALQAPVLASFLKKKNIKIIKSDDATKPQTKLFVACAALVTVLTGLLIPSTVIKTSPLEFVNVAAFYNPLWYIVSTLLLSAGLFLVWINVFYRLSNDKGKVVIESILSIFAVIFVIDYMFFGKKLGTLLPSLQYENQMIFATSEKLLNLAVIVVVAITIGLILTKRRKIVSDIMLICVLAFIAMSVRNIYIIKKDVNTVVEQAKANDEVANFSLSQNGQNVIVIMLDRAMGEFIPYIFTEKPELADVYSGFTYYENTLSYGGHTIIAGPAMFGGYEYTPDKINARSDEALVEKHNEALKVMPVLFEQNGFNVTVCDPPYANYQWTPDLSIFDDYPDIKTYNTNGSFVDENIFNEQVAMKNRNFFCYALTKSLPLVVQGTLYENGNYHNLSTVNLITQTISDDLLTATGLNENFVDAYSVLEELSGMTTITEDSSNNFLMLTNDTTHEQQLLQKEEYTISERVDNSMYPEEDRHANAVFGDAANRTLLVSNWSNQASQYHCTMGALLRIGEWLDFLKDNNVYDNTRIILVSDHGYNGQQLSELIKYHTLDKASDLESYFPLLMVKDFGTTDFTVNTDFITNAETPLIAVDGIIDNPVNPFTQKILSNEDKNQPLQYVLETEKWEPENNPGNQFAPSTWLVVDSSNIYDQNRWSISNENSTSPK